MRLIYPDSGGTAGEPNQALARCLANDPDVILMDERPVAAHRLPAPGGVHRLSMGAHPCAGPFAGYTRFTYTLETPDGQRDDATVHVRVFRVAEVARDGYQNFTLWEHLCWSLCRVIIGFFSGALVGIPLGYAMGLSDWFRGWFDPIVEFMRPMPPLALIPLVIIWAGTGETGKIILLFLAALWIMAIILIGVIGHGIDILMRKAEKWLVPWQGRV